MDYLEAQAKDYNKKLQHDVPLLYDCCFRYGYEENAHRIYHYWPTNSRPFFRYENHKRKLHVFEDILQYPRKKALTGR